MSTRKRSVSFNMHPEIKILYTWLYAYKQARKGTGHIEAVDRIRFQRRIQQTKNILETILLQHIKSTQKG